MKCDTGIIVLGEILVDTSIWIEYFRGNAPHQKEVLSLIEKGKVVCTGMIVAELLLGTKDDQDAKEIAILLDSFPLLEDTSARWREAGLLAARLRRAGFTVPLSDCLIACMAHANGASIYTKDNHFGQLQKALKLNLYKPHGAS